MTHAKQATSSAADHVPAFILPLVVVFGIALRLPGITFSFYGDEAFSLFRDSSQLITDSEDRFRPVFFTLLYLWRQLGFTGEFGLRLLPLIFGVAQIPLAFLVGRKLSGERLAITFALLLAVNPLLIEFSQELRMYSLVALIALAQVYVLLLLLKNADKYGRKELSSTDPQPHPSSFTLHPFYLWLFFIALGLLGVYTHLHYWIFLAGLSLTFLRERKVIAWWKGHAALAVIALLYLPNIPNMLYFQQVRGGEYFVNLPSALPKLFAALTGGFSYFKIGDQVLGRPITTRDILGNFSIFLLLAIPAVIFLWRLIGLHRERRNSRSLWLCHELFTAPVILAFVASVITKQYFVQPKYVIFVAPFALLFIAQIYLSFHFVALRRALTVVGVVVVTIALIHFNDAHDYGRREDWKGVAEVLKTELTTETPLVIHGQRLAMLRYYYPEAPNYFLSVRPPLPGETSEAYASRLLKEFKGVKEVYYVRSDIALQDNQWKDVVVSAHDLLGKRMGVVKFTPRMKLYHWKLNG
jgi:uncharacterized membrane protein